MDIQVTASPHMLLETVELLFAYINCTPSEILTTQGDFCIPPEEIRQIMAEACGEVSLDDPALRYFFEEYALPRDAGKSTCIARNLVYTVMLRSSGSLRDDCAQLKAYWKSEVACAEEIRSIGIFSLWLETKDKTGSVLDSIARLDADEAYIRKLQEQLCDYDAALDRLYRLIAPVAEKLEPLLRPWVKRAANRAQQWNETLREPENVDRFMRTLRYRNIEKLDQLSIQLRYLDAENSTGTVLHTEKQHSLFVHVGLAQNPFAECNQAQFDQWEFQAMRLLGSPARLRMLHALWDKPMSSRELAKALNLNLGTLCRDINSLYEYRLLIVEQDNNRRRYSTNRETMEYLARHMARLGELQLPKE